MNISVGCDPELFLENGSGEIVSAEGLIGGTKKKPRDITDEGHSLQEDNVMVEFNIPPATKSEEFVSHINFVKDFISNEIADKELILNYSASAMLDEKYLNTKQAKRFGCEPDWNVYTKETNPRPKAGGKLRSCGGHIHIGGYDNLDQRNTENVIKSMDIFLGLPSVWLDSDTRRRRMYGRAGSFRFKSFGCEYRVLSNFWTQNDELIKWAFDNTILAVENAFTCDLSNIDYNLVQEAINESNVELAKQLYNDITTNLVKKEKKKLTIKK